MQYKLRSGVTRVKICGTDLLVSTRSSWEECAVVRPISFFWAGCVGMLEKGKDAAEIARILGKALKKDPESIREKVENIFAELYQMGFLVPAEDENEQN